MTVIQQTYGEKIDYNPEWEGPLKIKRKQTDFPFLVSLGLYLVLWMGIATYAFASGDVSVSYGTIHLIHGISPESIFQEGNIILGFSLFTVLSSVTYI